MTAQLKPIVLIPARLKSARLPSKPLANIAGKPMILWVLESALKAAIGPVFVACAEKKIADIVVAAGGQAILTDPDHRSGSDRIFEALSLVDPENKYNVVINLQGDLPTIEPISIRDVLKPLKNYTVDIATLVTEIGCTEDRTNPNVVKAVLGFKNNERIARALYFTRGTAPAGHGPLYHHIGIYAYRRCALEHFIKLPVSTLEEREKLEQLRALEAGMRIDAHLVDTLPIGVDTSAELKQARSILGKKL